MLRLLHRIALCIAVALLPMTALAQTEGPDDVYRAYHETLLRSFNEQPILAYLTRAARDDFLSRYVGQQRTQVFFMMKSSAPRNVHIAAVEIQGALATLTLEGRDVGNYSTVGTAQMELEDGEWRIADVTWIAGSRR